MMLLPLAASADTVVDSYNRCSNFYSALRMLLLLFADQAHLQGYEHLLLHAYDDYYIKQ